MMRLQKYLALSGVASRRNSEKMILEGRVSVNHVPVTEMGLQVDEIKDLVEVDGKVVSIQEEKHYIAYYKPIGKCPPSLIRRAGPLLWTNSGIILSGCILSGGLIMTAKDYCF